MPSRAERSRASILSAARDQFAAKGFRGATIRSIAAAASIDPAMVIRYFGSKADLFAAAVDTDLHVPDLALVPREQLGEAVIEFFLDRWENDADATLQTLLRSSATDEHAAARIQALFAAQLVPRISAVIDDPTETPRRAGLIATQTIGLAYTRLVLRLPPVVALSRGEIVTQLGATIQRYLFDPLPLPH